MRPDHLNKIKSQALKGFSGATYNEVSVGRIAHGASRQLPGRRLPAAGLDPQRTAGWRAPRPSPRIINALTLIRA
jgi:hypothetical protein